ncbi:hypothetical protein PCCS19_12280 [Paenibacillus sp. CCS19]|uniref:DUF6612 family protein n=1 Tax=Paenibacillus sp. CCS19 TaxID=3158387 RepID=UPI002569C03D|nr:DUF6612 family protein [Paenibacillus cellulosilyticus]GMK38174.1 hypothetical protein PCCS19_12280 [Paenibacillus cellulosilyticus]
MRIPIRAGIRLMLQCTVGITLMMTVACSSDKAEETTSSGDASKLQQQLEQSAEAAAKSKTWTIEMKLGQKMDEEAMDMTTTGVVVREPLQMKQSIDSEYAGEKSKMETILTPDAYYMHDMATDDWTRMTASVIPEVKETLSDYQVKPSEPVKRLEASSSKLRGSTNEAGQLQYDYIGDGTDAGATAIIDDVLRGTFGGGTMTKEIADTIQVNSFTYQLTTDQATKLPVDVKMAMELTIEFEKGQPSTLHQTLDIKYSDWDGGQTVTVPEAAKKAEEITPPTQDLIDELERLQDEMGQQAPAS